MEFEYPLPQHDDASLREEASYQALKRALFPTFISRGEPQPDRGVDLTIELVEDGTATNIRAQIQVKALRDAPTDPALVRYSGIKAQNLGYLLTGQLPALYVLCTPPDRLYYKWADDALNDLRGKNPDWTSQETVTISFSEQLDTAGVSRIANRLKHHASQLQQLNKGRFFIRSLDDAWRPAPLAPTHPFIGRSRELLQLEAAVGPRTLLPVIGPSGVGRSELVAQFLAQSGVSARLGARFGAPVSVLFTDAGSRTEPRLLRGIIHALSVEKDLELAEIAEDAAVGREQVARLIAEEILPTRLERNALLLVIDNFDRCAQAVAEWQDLAILLNAPAIANACIITIAQDDTIPPLDVTLPCDVRAPLRLAPLSPLAATALLSELGVDDTSAGVVVKRAAEAGAHLLPAVLRKAVEARGGRSNAPLADAILERLVAISQPAILHEMTAALESAPPNVQSLAAAFAVLGAWSYSDDSLRDVASSSDLEIIHRMGLLVRGERLAATPTAVRHAVRSLWPTLLVSCGGIPAVCNALDRILNAIEDSLETHEFSSYALAIEEALAWLVDAALPSSRLIHRLNASLALFAVDDVLFPNVAEDTETRSQLSFAELTLKLVLAARIGTNADEFVASLRAVAKRSSNMLRLSPYAVQGIDAALALGQKRHRRFEDVLQYRRRMTPKLPPPEPGVKIAGYHAAISWLLNCASLAIGTGDLEAARKFLTGADTYEHRLPFRADVDSLRTRAWFDVRRGFAEARLTDDPPERLRLLHAGALRAFDLLLTSGLRPRWVRFVIRAFRSHMMELQTDTDREAALDLVLERFSSVFGEPSSWPATLLAPVLSVVEDGAARHDGVELRVERLLSARELAERGYARFAALARGGDTDPVIVYARLLALLAIAHRDAGRPREESAIMRSALNEIDFAMSCRASASAWDLRLSILDEHGQLSKRRWYSEPIDDAEWNDPDLQRELAACRKWLKSRRRWTAADGRLSLYCCRLEWISKGSIGRIARRDERWETMTVAARRALVSDIYGQRTARLGAIERRTGPMIDIYLTYARNAAQFQVELAKHGNHMVDLDAVFAPLQRAQQLWPGEHRILTAKAHLDRYFWNFSEALATLRRVVRGDPDGERRRRAILDYIEALVSAASRNETVRVSASETLSSAEMFAEADRWLPQVRGYSQTAPFVAALSVRIDFELGREIDWCAIDAAFDTIVGDVDEFLHTVIENLVDLTGIPTQPPMHFSESVLANWTSPPYLRILGQLYVRRSEKAANEYSLDYLRKAYAAFQAARILERNWLDRESTINSYQRARTIWLASRLTHSVDPFPASREGKGSLLALAEARATFVGTETVGMFRQQARALQSDISALRRSLMTS